MHLSSIQSVFYQCKSWLYKVWQLILQSFCCRIDFLTHSCERWMVFDTILNCSNLKSGHLNLKSGHLFNTTCLMNNGNENVQFWPVWKKRKHTCLMLCFDHSLTFKFWKLTTMPFTPFHIKSTFSTRVKVLLTCLWTPNTVAETIPLDSTQTASKMNTKHSG